MYATEGRRCGAFVNVCKKGNDKLKRKEKKKKQDNDDEDDEEEKEDEAEEEPNTNFTPIGHDLTLPFFN